MAIRLPIRIYLWGIGIIAILGWITVAFIVFITDPYLTDIRIFVAFFTCLLIGLIGLFTLIGYFVRLAISRKEVIYAHIGVSLRQAILISLILVGLLLLQSTQVLNWWDGTLLVAAILLLELYFRAK